jgi:D-3-phosphoglycerate dehydrogenase
MKPKVLLTDAKMNMLGSVMDRLTAVADVVTSEHDDEETLCRDVADADLIIICYADITRRVIAAAPKLKAILKWGVGVDSIDIDAATQQGLPVFHCPEYGTNTVADHAFALLIALARKLIGLNKEMQEKGWMWPSPPYAGCDLTGKTVGLVGFGRIGRAMARRCAGFDMKLIACDPYVKDPGSEWGDLKLVSLDELVETADFITIHCVLTTETQGLIGEGQFRKMKKSAYLVNVSRAAVIDETALVQALQQRQIAGAGLDVFHQEPIKSDHPLFKMDNVILTPHFAYLTREADARLDRDTLAAALAILQGQRPQHVKNPEVFESACRRRDGVVYSTTQ